MRLRATPRLLAILLLTCTGMMAVSRTAAGQDADPARAVQRRDWAA